MEVTDDRLMRDMALRNLVAIQLPQRQIRLNEFLFRQLSFLYWVFNRLLSLIVLLLVWIYIKLAERTAKSLMLEIITVLLVQNIVSHIQICTSTYCGRPNLIRNLELVLVTIHLTIVIMHL